MKREKPAELGPRQKRVLHLSTIALWLTGVLWFCWSEGDPAKSLCMKIHGAAAMIFLMVFGTLLFKHVPEGWQEERQRGTGSWLVGICGVLIITGWGLYYAGGEGVRHWTSLIHSAFGIALPVLLFIHAKLLL